MTRKEQAKVLREMAAAQAEIAREYAGVAGESAEFFRRTFAGRGAQLSKEAEKWEAISLQQGSAREEGL